MKKEAWIPILTIVTGALVIAPILYPFHYPRPSDGKPFLKDTSPNAIEWLGHAHAIDYWFCCWTKLSA